MAAAAGATSDERIDFYAADMFHLLFGEFADVVDSVAAMTSNNLSKTLHVNAVAQETLDDTTNTGLADNADAAATSLNLLSSRKKDVTDYVDDYC